MVALTAPISTMFHQHGSGRSCCRCQKELTDAASMEAGIGPICRKQDNALLANSIPANPPEALMHLLQIDDALLDPVSHNTFKDVRDELAANLMGTDWRKTIKRIEWILSFEVNRKAALEKFTAIAQSLGYLGLAALWNGQASTGQAQVWFANGRLWVIGPRNGAARYALKQLGGMFYTSACPPGSTHSKPAWSVPAKNADGFKKAIHTHYPMNVGMNDAILAAEEAAKQAAAQVPTTAAPAAPTTNNGGSVKHRIEQKGKTLNIKTPYDANFIADLKTTVPYAYRAWEPAEKAWKVDAQYLDQVSALILKHYKTQPFYLNLDALQQDAAKVAQHIDYAQAAIQPTPAQPVAKPIEVATPAAKAAQPLPAKPVVLPF